MGASVPKVAVRSVQLKLPTITSVHVGVTLKLLSARSKDLINLDSMIGA
jgi:hypothetical protein